MLFQKTLVLILVCALLSAQLIAQQKVVSPPETKPLSAAAEQQAVALLRETLKDVQNLKSPENRQYLSIEAADMLWKYDEPQARAIFQSAMNDVRDSLKKVSAEIVAAKTKSGQDDLYGANVSSSEVYDSLDPTLYFRIGKVTGMRRQLISALAENDPQWAENFLLETADLFSSSESKDMYSSRDNTLEAKIAVNLAKNDPDKAANIVRRMLTKGFPLQVVPILNAVYEQNADKGSQLAEQIRQKIMSANPSKEKPVENNYFVLQFFQNASANLEQAKTKPDKKPLLAEKSVRELAAFLGDAALRQDDLGYVSLSDVAAAIEKYAPEKAARIRAEQKRMQASSNTNMMMSNMAMNANRAVVSNRMTNTNRAMSNRLMTANTSVIVNSNSAGEMSDEIKKSRERAQRIEARQKQIKAEKDALTERLKQKILIADDRLIVVEQIKKIVAGSRRRVDKIRDYVYWAVASAAGGNVEIAQTLLIEAESLVNPQTKNAVDYMSKWWLAEGYSSVAPEKSFSILEEIIPPFNGVISGFAKVAEFIDPETEIVSNDEILISGAPLDLNRISSVLPGGRSVVRNLAAADFTRTKTLIDKFERLEFRLMARMFMLKSLLKPEDESIAKSSAIDYEMY